MNAAPTTPNICCGVDTHADTHHAAIVTGVLLDSHQFDDTATGYHDLEVWMLEHGHPVTVGVEGTASYGAGLTRHLLGCGISVVEVPRPNRKLRRNSGTSDPIDAEADARAVLARNQLAQPKRGDGPIESIRALRVARSGAVRAATASMNAVRSMIVTAPESLRTELRGHSVTKLLDICAAFEPHLTNRPTRSSSPYAPWQAAPANYEEAAELKASHHARRPLCPQNIGRVSASDPTRQPRC